HRVVAHGAAHRRADTREACRTLMNAGEYAGKDSATPEEIDAYYAENQQEFETPEQVRTAYVVLDRDAFASRIEVNEEEVRKQYEARIAQIGRASCREGV